MNYPLISEYIDAIKFAEDNFAELSYLRPVLGDDGLPVMTSGNFAVVFKMKDERDGKCYAVKCFTKEQEGRAEAYREITKELENVSSPYLISVRYFDKELFVDTGQTTETEFPVLLMDWVEGKTLDKYLRENLDDKYALEMLAYRFSQLAQWLIPQPFAHGDLKPDNILVQDDGSLVLVDYDGMYVPAMKGQKARELGSPDFRHPQRTDDDFDEHIDDFASVSILLSLKAISIKPLLLDEYGASDRLLFSQEDYQDIQLSRSISAILCLIHDVSILNVYTTFLYVFSQKVILLDNISSLEIEVSPDVIYDYAKSLSNQGDEKPAFVKWLFLASNGYAKAQNAIGVCYLKGYGVEQNKAEAINWFELAASHDCVSSIFNLGTCYRSGYGVEKDEHKAFQLYKHASKLKSEEAYYQMSLCYLKGFGVEENDSKALIWLKKAANKRFPKALFKLAGFYETGFLVDKDERKAILLYQKAANKGYKKALKKLGEIYRLGNCGLQVSYKKSFTYYFKAANLGDASSQFYIGYYYASGLGVKQDYQKAVEWYTRSSEQGHASALNNLAVCYKYGRGVDTDPAKAALLFLAAAKFGDAKSHMNVAKCNNEGIEVPFDTDNNSENLIIIDGALLSSDGKRLLTYFGNKETYIIPDGIESIEERAFYNNRYLQKIVFPEGLKEIGAYAFCKCGNLTELELPATTTELGEFSFYGCDSLNNVISLGNIKLIKEGTFMRCSLVSVQFPDELQGISENAFNSNRSLLTLSIPNSVLKIESGAFAYCGIHEIHLGEELKEIGDFCFFQCPIEKISLPSKIDYIGVNPFIGTKEIVCPSSCKFATTEGVLFAKDEGCLIACFSGLEVSIPGDIIQINTFAFYGSSIKSISMNGNTISIQPFAFYKSELLEKILWMNSRISQIPTGCFGKCNNIRQVSIPNTVKEIGEGAFGECELLKDVYFNTTITNGIEEMFNDVQPDFPTRSSVVDLNWWGLSGATIEDRWYPDIDNLVKLYIHVPKGCSEKYAFSQWTCKTIGRNITVIED